DDDDDDDDPPARRRSRGGDWWPRSPGPRGSLSAPRRGTRFGTTWWGRAWVEALEQRARLDHNRLPRGRTYARSGAVGPLTLAPGEVSAPVQGSRAAPYVVRLRVREFTGDEWRAVLTAIAARASHAAALLEGVLEPAVVDDVAREGIALLPAAGEIGPSCSCPDWANPCKHAAAVCYLVADRMDEDPFTILLLRGRSREQALAGLRSLRGEGAGAVAAPPASAEPVVDPGVEARTLPALQATAALPAPPPPPPRPGLPASLAVDPPAGAPVRGEDLRALAADAARRAWELAQGTGDGGLDLSVEADLARLAAQRLGGSGFDDLAARAGARPRALMRTALAWHLGGRAAFEVLDGPGWQPPADVVEEGQAAVAAAFGRASVRGERVTRPGWDCSSAMAATSSGTCWRSARGCGRCTTRPTPTRGGWWRWSRLPSPARRTADDDNGVGSALALGGTRFDPLEKCGGRG
ncbi:MAG TPA: SWIM zinc finger family protein, partial [Candidatus Dormibacteraeota bacterium]